MTWQKLSDDWYDHDKVRALTSSEQICLWVVACGLCCSVDSDGLLTASRLESAIHFARVPAETAPAAVAAIVAAGLWHDARSLRKCERCKAAVKELPTGRLGPGDFFFHDWLEHQLAKAGKHDEMVKWREARRKDLNRRSGLKWEVRQRDRDTCRYCGTPATFDTADKRSPTSGTFDHIDPFCTAGPKEYGNVAENLVVAHRVCNGRKKDQTPEQAGMPLLPVPLEPDLADLAGIQIGPDREPDPSGAVLALACEAGRGQVGPGSEPDRNWPGAGPGSDLKDPTEGGAENG